ncbi:tyrosine-type recombinase/integrase [Leptospira borgpetersenii]|uniref:tyrosine-type recombinase/integrase n=1 Tax=Leptospira borgpetersenii TaxID=174 RepID=UPI000774752A|nr:tyrosine-type recombinase/integrase [Leptospira borgpetersenii]
MKITLTNSNVIPIDIFKSRLKANQNSFLSTETYFGKGLLDKDIRKLKNRYSIPKSEEDFRNRALLSVMTKTGMRAKELVSLKFSNLIQAPSGETIVTYFKKGGRIAYSVIPNDSLNYVKSYHKKFGIDSDYFFLSRPGRNQTRRSNLTTRGLQLIVNSWGVKTCAGKLVHPHALRHTVGAKLLETSGSIAAQKVLGHSTPVTTSKFYTKPYYDGSKFLTWDS